MAAPQNFRQGGPAVEASLANVAWWDLFKDENLRFLINVALHENHELKIAVERIEEARATYGIAKADFYPAVSANVTGGALNTSNSSLTHTQDGNTDTKALMGASLGFSWEIDFFGRIRRASEAQRAQLMATEEARRAVAISLVSDVALAYVDLRSLDRRLDVAKTTLVSRKEQVEFSKTRFQGSVANEVDFRQAEAELYRIQSQVYDYEKLVSQRENELSFLVGRNPAAIMRNRSAEDQPIPPEVPVGLPAALLDRRPDVRRAEMDLWSATARIGEARAMLYPRISLTGSYGLASDDLSELIDPASQTWNLFANLMQPIFEGGKNTARVEMRESQHRQALYAYQRTLLNALREVEDALVGFRSAGQQRTALRERVVAERKVLELATLRYKGGVADYLEVLDSQRSLFDAEISDANAASEHSKSLIRLYKALGGGWPAPPPADGSKQPAPAAASANGSKPPAPAPVAVPAPAADPAPAPPAAPAPPK
jgi:multidrug efflux system outer membrane protein